MRYLYHFQSTDYVWNDCIEEFLTIASNKKEAIKRFREALRTNSEILNRPEQVYNPEWWSVYRYPLLDVDQGLDLARHVLYRDDVRREEREQV